MDVGVVKENKEMFEKKLEEDDVQFSHGQRLEASHRSDRSDEEQSNLFLDIQVKFNSFEQIEAWCANMAALYSIVEKRPLTITYQKNNMFLLKLSTGKKKCAVVIIAGEEGRDWISPAVALNFVANLLENPRVRPLLSIYDFYIIPVVNPDGYEYSRKSDRFWSKNRNHYYTEKKCSESSGIGVTIDRNWFLAATIPYVADIECYSVYGGQKSISEEETRALSMFLNRIANKLMAFIDIRGFERAITIPYAHSLEQTNNHNLMMQILGSVSAILRAQHNVSYFYGSTAQFLYNFTGNCADWVKKNLNIPVVYTVFLKDLDNFLPDPSEIKPLSDQFATIVNETLLIAYDIYGTLFNNSTKDEANSSNIIFCLLTCIIRFY